jgi:cellulose synthase/poly-beta-1,6-N-acetylglucosamine synthase-like glycosyltransferase
VPNPATQTINYQRCFSPLELDEAELSELAHGPEPKPTSMAARDVHPLVSVILPARNADANIAAALDAISRQDYPHYEVIITSDGSTDRTNEICQEYPYKLIVQEWQGTAAAENAGAVLSRGKVLYFTDADVLMPRDTLRRVVETLRSNPEIAGLSGCYSKETPEANFFSVYKNALHRYVHRTNGRYTVNLFGANSAIWKEAFEKVGGFNSEQKVLEDVELGFRLVRARYRILMAKDIEVTHHKKYTFWSLVSSDVYGRVIPWVIVMLKNRRIHFDLNVRPRNILSFVAVWSVLFAVCPVSPQWSAICGAGSVIVFCSCNAGLLSYMRRQFGWWFVIKAAAFTYFSYFYQGVGLALGFRQYLRENQSRYGESLAVRNHERIQRHFGPGSRS